MQNLTGTIKTKEKISSNAYKIEIISSLKEAKPGQFISVLCAPKSLRRPFSISDFDNGLITILFKPIGEGTKYLADLNINDCIDFIAPLGNGFSLSDKKALLVGAGIGIAPMLYLKKELNKKGTDNYLITGFKEKEEVIEGSDEVTIGGSVLDRIDELIKEKNIEIIYSCAPQIVLKRISQIALENNIVCELAMEKVMACSIGVCRGCVIRLMKKNEIVYASVCKDGPVFKGSEIIWD